MPGWRKNSSIQKSRPRVRCKTGRKLVASFIVLGNFTDQGMRDIKNSPDRVDAAKNLAKSLGAEMKDFSLTIGAYDFVVTMEAPDDETAAKFSLTIGSMGNVRTTTLKAFPEAEYKKIINSMP